VNEFELIERFFSRSIVRDDVVVGIGDDGAVLSQTESQDLVVVTDTLVAGVHFFSDQSPAALGHKLLAVNLSDLAAMGATPAWVTLNLVLPEAESDWLREFSREFFALAESFNVALVGGDTTCGPLSLTATLGGSVPRGDAILRSGARIGDAIYVSGTLGDAALGLNLLLKKTILIKDEHNPFLQRLMRPEPRVSLGKSLRCLASGAIDISDGLLADLNHLVVASGNVGAVIYKDWLPICSEHLQFCTRQEMLSIALTGGDDYELCFCIAPVNQESIDKLGAELNLSLTMIGHVDATPGVRVIDEINHCREYNFTGYLHHWPT